MTVIHSTRLVTDAQVTENAWVQMTDAVVTATGAGDDWRRAAPDDDVVDAAGAWLTPGFIDIHGHGGGAAAYDDGPEAIATAVAVHRAHGTTRSVLSLVTASVADLAQRAAMIAELTASDPLILGSHLEGPFLDVGHKGAHTADLLVAPTRNDIETLLSAAGGSLRQITLAPELSGGLDAVRAFSDAGVRVAVGHTDADYETTLAAFDAGATLLTHAFNAMNGIHHRAPGPVIATLGRDDVTLEVINDGTHVHADVVRMLFGEAPGRVALITDAMAAAGAADGAYTLGGLDVTVRNGVARLDDGSEAGGSIAGSTLLLDEALRRAVTDVRLPIEQAVDAVTGAPARALGLSELGSLRPGFAADAVLLSPEFDVLGVWAEGNRLR
ncbi:N-acetylglucosamine-6-phosphate deacetylase [Paramicrobacterium agarici]|uniref:N-acetylglucosamine-6-phosphate deacetylase n=1 Tax=Paramicrobacterium agarici TaxID=630514 RepID=UPI00114F5000|nr:N-acetylglucosamine-6-phosphate deacetylase [Microbacterium agarici]TQO21908.1 N-acetylglucosamine 6-phosphate deacetylase [Microbacterium agarici]